MQPFTNRHWRTGIDKKPGVYVIWRTRGKQQAVYIGETSLLKERLGDLGHWRNHTFTCQIQENLKDTGKSHTPEAIRSYIKPHFLLSYLPLDFGRKEVEEYLIDEWETERPKGFNRVPSRYRQGKGST